MKVSLLLVLAGVGMTGHSSQIPGQEPITGPAERGASPGFNQISVEAPVHVNLILGASGPVEISGPADEARRVVLSTENARLHVALSGSQPLAKPLTVTIHAPFIEAITASSGSLWKVKGLNASRFRIAAMMGSNVEVEGKSRDLTVGAYDSSHVTFGRVIGGSLNLTLYRDAKAKIVGEAGAVQVTSSFASNADLSRLAAAYMDLNLNNASVLKARVSGNVVGEAKKASTAVFAGNPTLSIRTRGGASITTSP
ncbi:MAG: DUF2807 domain-containing protein [Armatimonadetes bacterium]|nr:DUF2807 domain-containing protein [Armatimonadota bacterium]